jgi:hypothetical protein
MVLGLTEVSCRDQQIFGLSQISRVLCGSDERKKSSLTWINGSPAQAGGDVNLGMNALFCRYLGWDCQPLPTFPCRPELLFWIPLDTGVDGCLSQLALIIYPRLAVARARDAFHLLPSECSLPRARRITNGRLAS